MKFSNIKFAVLLLFTILCGAGGQINPIQAATPAQSITLATQPATSTQVSVLVELQAPPVTAIYAEMQAMSAVQAATATQVTAATQTQLATIEQAQQRTLTALQALNATVMYRNQRVYNGIAVRIATDKLAQLAQLPEVKAVHRLVAKYPAERAQTPLSGAPVLWQAGNGPGITGQGITIAIIDTGVDYLHTDFGGPGTGYAANNPTKIGDVAGFPGEKVIGGYDFTGNLYNADPDSNTYQPLPTPDPDPMDCYAHGTHVAGIAAGYGVDSNGNSYRGAYNTATQISDLRIPPGVAPAAKIYALKVFGCAGSSEVVDQGIEWAVDPNADGDLSDHVDVINLSLGSSYGTLDDPTSIASTNAVAAGIVVVASAGNSGDVTYVSGSPAIADAVISVAAGQITTNNFETLANFSSRGPRRFDAMLKPDITAPGYRIISAGQGTGNNSALNSGTSMAAPHVAGAMALLRQLHPDWRVEELKALIMNSAMTQIRTTEIITAPFYSPVRIGAGQLDLEKAQKTDVLAYNADNPGLVSVSFGAPEVLNDTTALKNIRLANKSNQTAAYNLTYAGVTETPGVTFILPTQLITVAAGGFTNVPVMLSTNVAQMQHTRDRTLAATQAGRSRQWLNEKSGYLLFWPATGLFTATLSGAKVTPAIVTDLQGAATFHYDPQTHVLSYTLQLSGDPNPGITSVSINRGPAGVNGATAYTLGTNITNTLEPLTSALNLNSSDELLLRAGELYINVTTQANPQGAIRGQIDTTAPILAVPLYAAPRPAGAIRAVQSKLDFGEDQPTSQLIRLQGVGLTGNSIPTLGVPLVSVVELQWSSPNLPPANIITTTEGSQGDLYDHADLKYVGVTSDFGATRDNTTPNGAVDKSTLYFGIVSYGNWSTPNEVQFEIYIDSDLDGVDDFMLFNTDQLGYNSNNVMSDAFVTALKNLHTGVITPQATLNAADTTPTQLDTAPFNSNVMLLPIRANLLGLTDLKADFDYRVESYSNDRPRIGDGARRYVDRSARLHYDLQHSRLDLSGGKVGAPQYPDLEGEPIPVKFEQQNASQSNSQGILLLHHHNMLGLRDEVVTIQASWPATLYLPMIGKR
ncbi:MAG: S8 family serine peptidase [Chloroflexi bacterium]|nr:S8 family serine peptidase [Chloroflexota bacterium]